MAPSDQKRLRQFDRAWKRSALPVLTEQGIANLQCIANLQGIECDARLAITKIDA